MNLELTKSIANKFEKWKENNFKRFTATFDEIYSLLTEEEAEEAKQLLKLKPKDFGLKGIFYGLEDVPEDLVEVGDQIVTKAVFEKLQEMNKAMKEEINKELKISSGYRSPAYQLALFFVFLKRNDYDLEKTAKQIALPGYSEHGSVKQPAIDFKTDTHSAKDFKDTEEYQWLLKNANKFGFYLSYPENNEHGIQFEPWHWHLSF